jgi:small multidrug resistance pump
MKWILLFIGIIAELCGTTCMKMSDGFTNLYTSIFTFVFWAIGLTIFIFALKKFDLSFAFALWSGLGIVGVSIIGMVYFKEPYSIMKIISISIIVVGVIMLNASDMFVNKV